MTDAQTSVEADRRAIKPRRGARSLPDRPPGRKLRPLWELWPYVRRHTAIFWPALALLLGGVALTLYLPVVLRGIVDDGLATGDRAAVNRGFQMFLGVIVAMTLVTSTRFYFMSMLGERAAADLRSDVYGRLIHLSQRYYASLRTGEAVSRLTADVTLIESFLGSSASMFLRSLLGLIGALILMFAINWRLTSVLFVAAPVIMLPMFAIGRRVRKLSTSAQDRIADAAAEASESLDSIDLVQAYGQEANRAQRFKQACEAAFQAARRRIAAQTFMSGAVVFALFAGVAVVAWLAIQEVLADRMTSGQLAQFAMYALSGVSGFGVLADVYNAAMRTSGAIQRCSEILAETPEITAPENPTRLPSTSTGEVCFEDVVFCYPGDEARPALNGFSLQIQGGETVALVGPSGAGKSTVFRLLLRFYDPDQGRVLLDNVEARNADPLDWRAHFGYVPQDATLFSGNALENVRFGAPDASEQAAQRALEMARAWDFLADKDGLATEVGGRGNKLSGGQRQRVAVARALVREASVMLLDEATSSLDAENERLVQQALDAASKGRTTLVIAHRLATVRRADRIIVMDRGRVVEQGTHAELVEKGGLYAQLAELQFAGGKGSVSKLSE